MDFVAPQTPVGQAERNNRVIKERIRATFHRLPFDRLPKLMLVTLVMESAKKLNWFAPKLVFPSTTEYDTEGDDDDDEIPQLAADDDSSVESDLHAFMPEIKPFYGDSAWSAGVDYDPETFESIIEEEKKEEYDTEEDDDDDEIPQLAADDDSSVESDDEFYTGTD
eukprot:CAMPEP_0113453106 /NCGR_PEP_ID=MMETSP0014_2-20120614/7189_1 /TAXON_ID=2857 /ORGANISM="Nitzschia sp." /LENGTH=165 /DNA_ID=CAMNT_0000344495 /DNA_START=236 /DNA_END=733 /DNA_ORIENTATION=- /assembly_acc=CAM_ASM_000159